VLRAVRHIGGGCYAVKAIAELPLQSTGYATGVQSLAHPRKRFWASTLESFDKLDRTPTTSEQAPSWGLLFGTFYGRRLRGRQLRHPNISGQPPLELAAREFTGWTRMGVAGRTSGTRRARRGTSDGI
jgi:hypothetical protein